MEHWFAVDYIFINLDTILLLLGILVKGGENVFHINLTPLQTVVYTEVSNGVAIIPKKVLEIFLKYQR